MLYATLMCGHSLIRQFLTNKNYLIYCICQIFCVTLNLFSFGEKNNEREMFSLNFLEIKTVMAAQLKAFSKDVNGVSEYGKNVRINVWQTKGNILKRINCNLYILP